MLIFYLMRNDKKLNRGFGLSSLTICKFQRWSPWENRIYGMTQSKSSEQREHRSIHSLSLFHLHTTTAKRRLTTQKRSKFIWSWQTHQYALFSCITFWFVIFERAFFGFGKFARGENGKNHNCITRRICIFIIPIYMNHFLLLFFAFFCSYFSLVFFFFFPGFFFAFFGLIYHSKGLIR